MPCYEVTLHAPVIVSANDRYDAPNKAGPPEPGGWRTADSGDELDAADCAYLGISPACCLPLTDGVCDPCAEEKEPGAPSSSNRPSSR